MLTTESAYFAAISEKSGYVFALRGFAKVIITKTSNIPNIDLILCNFAY